MNFGQKVVAFNKSLKFAGELPADIRIMNPFTDNICAMRASADFYAKFYADDCERGIILGINPGRFGAAITGVPFTDPVRLAQCCHIEVAECPKAREPSSEFVYEMIKAYGGVGKFYMDWYVNSICPLGFIRKNSKGKWVNYNYYDESALQKCALPFILQTLPLQLAFGIRVGACICLGTGKNYAFISKLNEKHGFFGKIIPLEHPRYVLQYKSGEKLKYIDKYLQALALCRQLNFGR